jgi:hypothetical protein
MTAPVIIIIIITIVVVVVIIIITTIVIIIIIITGLSHRMMNVSRSESQLQINFAPHSKH